MSKKETSDGGHENSPIALKTRGLKASAEQKSRAARQRVVDALDRLIAQGQGVGFRSVATEAGVSRAYLYAQSDLRARIDALRQSQSGGRLRLVSGPAPETVRTEKSKDFLLAAKDKRIRELAEENKGLKEQIKRLRGKLYQNL